MTRPAGVATEMFASNVVHRVADNGNNLLENLRIFKTGTFTDMFGFERTWDDLHLAQMVQHYGLLRDGGYLPDVPIRADHSMSIRDVVGYFQDIYLDPEDGQFLSATVEFTEPDAWDKWNRGTWRSRSIEIGMYETNDGRAFWPVVMGLAFVDIPAVEGLHARQSGPGHFFHFVTDNEESQVTVPNIDTNPQEWTQAVAYAAWEQAANYAQACQNWESAVTYAAALEAEAAAQNPPAAPAITGVPANHGAPAGTPAATPPAPQMMAFRVNGQQTSDFASVQAHIDVLEQFRTETTTAGRQAFVEDLAQRNIIPVTQVAGLQAHAMTLNDEQFASFRAMYANATAAPGFASFGNQENAQTPPVNGGQGPSQDAPLGDIETAKEIVAQHRRAGLAEEKVKQTDSYKKLVAAGITL